MMTRRVLLIISLFAVALMASARRRHKVVEVPLEPVLTQVEQQHFDSLYFLALTLEQCQQPDSARGIMTEAISYYTARHTKPGLTPGLSAAYYFLGNQYREAGELPKALGCMQLATSLDSINYWYTEAEGDLLMQLNQVPLAAACYERLVRNYPDKTDPLYAMANIYLRLDSAEACLAVLDRLEALEDISAQICMHRFLILHELGRTDEGFEQYRRLLQRYPSEPRYRLQLGDLQMKYGQIQQAKQSFDEAAALEPDNAYVWLAQSNYYAITGNQVEANKLVKDALVNPALDVETQLTILTDYLKQAAQTLHTDSLGISQSIDTLFVTITTMHPTEPEFYRLHADWLRAFDMDSLAAEQMRFAVDLRPSNVEYWNLYLSLSAGYQQPEAMRRLCEEALALHPDMYVAYLIMAFNYRRSQQYALARQQLEAALSVIPSGEASRISDVWGEIAETYHREGNMEKVYECYDMAMKYNPNNYMAMNNVAYYLSLEGRDLVRAESLAQKVIQQYPDNATYLDTYAWILYLQGSTMLAKFYQQRAIDNLNPEDADVTIYEHFGDILLKDGDLQGALEQWQKALPYAQTPSETESLNKKIESANVLLNPQK